MFLCLTYIYSTGQVNINQRSFQEIFTAVSFNNKMSGHVCIQSAKNTLRKSIKSKLGLLEEKDKLLQSENVFKKVR